MLTPFSAEKTIQAAAVLLKTTDDSRMTRLRLIKLLYIADRESIQETGVPITGDQAYALPNGPVLTRTYDAIKGEGYDTARWAQFLRPSGQDVVLAQDPGVPLLARFEVRKLQEVALRFESLDDWALVNHTHTFEEWRKHAPAEGGDGPRARAIPTRDILVALGMEEQADELIAEGKALGRVSQLLAKAAVG